REPWAVKALRKGSQAARSPEARRKMAEATRGKPCPEHVREAVRRANRRRKVTPATRARMRAAQRGRGARGAYHYPTGRPGKKGQGEVVRKGRGGTGGETPWGIIIKCLQWAWTTEGSGRRGEPGRTLPRRVWQVVSPCTGGTASGSLVRAETESRSD